MNAFAAMSVAVQTGLLTGTHAPLVGGPPVVEVFLRTTLLAMANAPVADRVFPFEAASLRPRIDACFVAF